jgi:hypothetical protein
VQVQTQFVSKFDLWFPKQADQRVLWPATVQLSEEYFQSLGKHAVPLDHRAVAALSSSSMALDVYAWLAQRLHRIPSGKQQQITWSAMYDQFGQGFARLRDFRRNFLQTLHQVHAAYPQARIEVDEVGLILLNSPPPVAPRNFGSLQGRKATGPNSSNGNLLAPPTSANPSASKGESNKHTPVAGDLSV